MITTIKKILYKTLPTDLYLEVLTSAYFVGFNLGLFKKNRRLEFPYFLPKIIKEGDTCIDIGANLGHYTVPIAKIVGTTGKVYAVEPVSEMRKVLLKKISKFNNVEVLPYALGEENKPIRLGNDSIKEKGFMATGRHYVLNSQDKHAAIEFNAEMRKGSELFANLDRINFIKCDIEGYELVVFIEMEMIIKKHLPLVYVETQGDNRKKMIKFFQELGYTPYVIYRGKLYLAKENEPWDILFIHEIHKENLKKYIAGFTS